MSSSHVDPFLEFQVINAFVRSGFTSHSKSANVFLDFAATLR